jgi:SAM-dependent methyltransferase
VRVTDASSATTKRVLMDAYDDAADAFASVAHPAIYRHLAEPLAAALAEVTGPVLDVAAGVGALGYRLPPVVAFDISARQLAHNPADRRVRGDAERLPFRDGSFAAVACVFGINHFPDARAAIVEMARVAPIVGLLTWSRPERPYRPKQLVAEALERRFGRARSTAGMVLDELSDAVGSAAALHGLLAGAGLRAEAWSLDVEVPWPGVDAWLDYRLGMPSTRGRSDESALADVRRELAATIAALTPAELSWRPALVLALGRRP